MKATIFTAIFLTAVAAFSASAEEEFLFRPHSSEALPYPEKGPLIGKDGRFAYNDIKVLDAVLRLAAEAKLQIVISAKARKLLEDQVTTAVLGQMTPKEVIYVLVGGNLMDVNILNGCCYIQAYEEKYNFSEFPGPVRAARLARYKAQYYTALLREGFSKEAALRIVVSEPSPPIKLVPVQER
jgi:hypothetical protein